MSVCRVPDSVPEADPDPFAEECLCCPFWHYQALRDLGLIVFPTRYGAKSLVRYDRAQTALKDRKSRAFHRRSGRPAAWHGDTDASTGSPRD